jgi:8-oxo-dGTP diphosphatase
MWRRASHRPQGVSEVKEELGLQRDPQRLLIVDWAPHAHEGDKILYIFDCGELGADENHIQLATDELDRWEWVPVRQLPDYVIPRLARRLAGAYHAYSAETPTYLEHGERVLPLALRATRAISTSN